MHSIRTYTITHLTYYCGTNKHNQYTRKILSICNKYIGYDIAYILLWYQQAQSIHKKNIKHM